ncbi:hypothetical protein GCM10010345_88080 [Streptomyces canarius]|uniref:Uncharacterized protein n=1 Tax=Streptomyces canarius TaxID=285453 RepID=A0ABQ3DA66_9ACTN|nr:hypothetical protein GCM10010345_88080 [Streptomyces canarius]
MTPPAGSAPTPRPAVCGAAASTRNTSAADGSRGLETAVGLIAAWTVYGLAVVGPTVPLTAALVTDEHGRLRGRWRCPACR